MAMNRWYPGYPAGRGDAGTLGAPTLTGTLLVLLASMVAGGFGSLVGIGGGLIIVPVLSVLLGHDVKVAIAASLVGVIALSLAASPRYIDSGIADRRLGLFLLVAASVGGLTGGLTASSLDGRILALLFGDPPRRGRDPDAARDPRPPRCATAAARGPRRIRLVLCRADERRGHRVPGEPARARRRRVVRGGERERPPRRRRRGHQRADDERPHARPDPGRDDDEHVHARGDGGGERDRLCGLRPARPAHRGAGRARRHRRARASARGSRCACRRTSCASRSSSWRPCSRSACSSSSLRDAQGRERRPRRRGRSRSPGGSRHAARRPSR